ncbi:hypothetical protein B0H19DRAFT_1268790 [Mycena capillaripes]|nr:hypothetical protein B0H19DRAFT_1268790 [Mycena capillaripes]
MSPEEPDIANADSASYLALSFVLAFLPFASPSLPQFPSLCIPMPKRTAQANATSERPRKTPKLDTRRSDEIIDLCSSEDEGPLRPQPKASGGGGEGKSVEIDLSSDDDATRLKQTKKADAESIVAELIDLCSDDDESPPKNVKIPNEEIDISSGNEQQVRYSKARRGGTKKKSVESSIDLFSSEDEERQISSKKAVVDLSSNGNENNHKAAQAKSKSSEGSTANRVGTLWAETAANLFSWQTDSQRAVSTGLSLVDQLYQVHAAGSLHQHIVPSPPHSAVFNRLSVNSQTLLLRVVQGKYTDAIEDGITNGILAESGHGDKRTQGRQIVYVRVGRSKNASPECAPAACIRRYIESYPADLVWGIVEFIQRGESAEDAEDLVRQILVNAGLNPEIAVPLLQIVRNVQPLTQIDGPHLYFGVSDVQTAHERLQHDLNQKGTRFCNFAHANKKFVSFKAYEMSEFVVPSSTGLRTDRNAGQVEVQVIHTLNELGLNHAVGGYIPYFTTNPAFTTLISGLLPSTTSLFGIMPCPVSTSLITAHLQDQKRYLINHVVGNSISPTSFAHLLQNGPGVFRTNEHCIPGLRLMDVISLEDHQSKRGQEKIGGIWDASTGRTLKIFRHLVTAIHPEIPVDGDLTEDAISQYLGPSLDLWPVTPKPWLFWNHCMWTSRTLVDIGVIVVTTWSEVVDSAMSGGYFALVWAGIPSDVRAQVFDGVTPDNIEQFLPSTSSREWAPHQSDHDQYLKNIGQLRIIQHGPNSTDLLLTVANLHPGAVKPDADKAYIAFNIILCTELIYQTALAEVEILRQEGMVPSRTSEDEAWRYFETLKARVEGKIGVSGLEEKLEQAKSEYRTLSWIHGHLRRRETTTKPRKPRRPDFTIPGVTHTVGRPGTPERIAQFDTLKTQWRKRTRGGVNRDPFHLIPYEYKDDPFGADMRLWFLTMKQNLRISNSARTSGSTPESHARAMESRAALSRNKEALSLGGHMTTALLLERKRAREDIRQMILTCIQQLGEWRTCTGGVQPKTGSCLAEAWRWGTCPLCSEILVANSENSKHACAEDEEGEHVRDSRFPSLQPLHYLHDVLNAPELVELLGLRIEQLELVSLSALEILTRPENLELRQRELPGLDLAEVAGLNVYVKKEDLNNNWWQATLAVDVCLPLVSICPEELWPTTALDRGKAWAHKGQVANWSPNRTRHFIKCGFGYVGILQPRSGAFDHACERMHRISEASGVPAANLSRRKGGPRDCDVAIPIQKHLIQSRFDLPPDYLRAQWYLDRVFPKLEFLNEKGKARR